MRSVRNNNDNNNNNVLRTRILYVHPCARKKERASVVLDVHKIKTKERGLGDAKHEAWKPQISGLLITQSFPVACTSLWLLVWFIYNKTRHEKHKRSRGCGGGITLEARTTAVPKYRRNTPHLHILQYTPYRTHPLATCASWENKDAMICTYKQPAQQIS